MMAPLSITGKIKSLFVTHNSWFVGNILPRIFPEVKIELKNYNINCSLFFNRMNYAFWMQNGKDVPPSYKRIEINKKNNKNNNNTPVVEKVPEKAPEKFYDNKFYDGVRKDYSKIILD